MTGQVCSQVNIEFSMYRYSITSLVGCLCYVLTACLSDWSDCYILVLILAVKDPIPLRHFGKKEMLAKIDLMEDRYDVPMWFDPDHIPACTTPAAAGEEIGLWGYGVAVFSAARGHRKEVVTPSLMANMYGFTSEEEMSDTKDYLHSHGNYQLEQVSVTQLVRL